LFIRRQDPFKRWRLPNTKVNTQKDYSSHDQHRAVGESPTSSGVVGADGEDVRTMLTTVARLPRQLALRQ
jgi:hypothetical protein